MKKFLLSLLLLCSLVLIAEDDHECTSWMVFSDLTQDGVNILHKNRDNKTQNVSAVMSSPEAKRKWIGLGSPKLNSPTMGFNESGLAVAVNSGEKTAYHSTNLNGKSMVIICKAILENCDTALEAVEMLKGFIAAKDYYYYKSGSIFLFMDTQEGYICEITAHYVAVRKYNEGYICRANIWRFPEMAQFSKSPPDGVCGNAIREYAVISSLNRALENNKKIELKDIIDLARNSKLYVPKKSRAAVCGQKTLSALTMVMDKEFPGTLSYGYALIGYPRHTVCVPLPICLDKLPADMVDGSWSSNSYKRLEKQGRFNEIPAEWIEFENASRKRFAETLFQARTLLRENRRDEAIKHINQVTAEIWQDAAKFIVEK